MAGGGGPGVVIEMAAWREVGGFSSLRNLAAVCGGLAGIGGIIHGVGEVVQGSQAPGGIVFDSWTEGRIAENLGGEPAMSLVPELLITGTLTIVVSLAVFTWAVAFVDRRYGGRVLVVLSVLMLLVGGGFGPPVLGMLAGAVAGGAHARRQGWERPLAGRAGRLLSFLWPGLFWLCVLNAVFLVIGSLVLSTAFDVAAPDLFVYSLFLVVVSMPLATLAGIADGLRQVPEAANQGAGMHTSSRAHSAPARTAPVWPDHVLNPIEPDVALDVATFTEQLLVLAYELDALMADPKLAE